MADIVSPEIRSKMMSAIRGKNTKPELLIRKGLHALGYRYRLHLPNLPGKPDMVFPKHSAVIEINGCFWHGHGCHMFSWPSGKNRDFWRKKIGLNMERDRKNLRALEDDGWRVLVVWECAVRGKEKWSVDELILEISRWLESGTGTMEIGSRG